MLASLAIKWNYAYMNVSEVGFVSSDRELRGSLFLPEVVNNVGRAAVLLAHGHGWDRSDVREYAETIAAKAGAVCLTFDLSGYGESQGVVDDLSPRDHLGDMMTAFDYLSGRSRELSIGWIGVAASSYSGPLAALLSDKRWVQGLLLRAPTLYANDQLDTPRRNFNAEANRACRLNPSVSNLALQALRPEGARVMVVESELDDVVPKAVIDAYLAASHGTHKVILGAGHSLTDKESRAKFKDILVEWAKNLSSK